MAETLERKINSFERIDRMLASAEARRNNALREIDRHREAMGTSIRSSIDEAEVRDVETGKTRGSGGILTSDRQRRANGANARASTGPKTRAGKARSAKNALRRFWQNEPNPAVAASRIFASPGSYRRLPNLRQNPTPS